MRSQHGETNLRRNLFLRMNPLHCERKYRLRWYKAYSIICPKIIVKPVAFNYSDYTHTHSSQRSDEWQMNVCVSSWMLSITAAATIFSPFINCTLFMLNLMRGFFSCINGVFSQSFAFVKFYFWKDYWKCATEEKLYICTTLNDKHWMNNNWKWLWWKNKQNTFCLLAISSNSHSSDRL